MSLFIFLIPLSYLISLLPAASKYSAVNLLLIQIVLVTLFLIGAYLTKTALGNKIIHIGLLTSGYVIVVFGIMNWLGNGKLAGTLVSWFTAIDATGIYKDAVMTDSNGLRSDVRVPVRQYVCGLLDRPMGHRSIPGIEEPRLVQNFGARPIHRTGPGVLYADPITRCDCLSAYYFLPYSNLSEAV
ncbi:hypothetical protein [Paenibacillus sp. 1P03SA]|uniref:hypothetical protein n=1 Tax=Paenibacillus sp. 1P03SA TaxID=3132294 RepID=UPI0039A3D179